ncbi:MAG: SDR family oxidoreductase [Candidatus Omnitrophica bacterium]|nr:SDR family oxidoreductase [Candidatus Omnitrophota bacterium]
MKYDDLFCLKGKVAVVAGGAGLIGKEIARGLSAFGASVVAADINKNAGRHVDIANERSVSSLIKFVDKKYGRMDIWVNSAYPRTGDWALKFEDVPVSSWRKNIDTHLNGYFICCRNAAEYMKKKGGGSIINLASIYGMVGPDFSIYKNTKMTCPGAYSAIKGGIIAFTRYLASYYGGHGVRVNCISPGGVRDRQADAFVKRYSDKTPLGRMAKAVDIAGAAIYLASDASGYVTGHNLVVDGGWTAV